MCGIVGYFGLPLTEDERLPLLRGMAEAVAHRGPDDDGYFTAEYCGLGMRRLSIIDLVKGHQPISDSSGKHHIVFNGEIYNYRELRPRLQSEGYQFSTDSDTEVILNQYLNDGHDCVQQLNGMFTIAICDTEKRSLFLARDRMGVKPLYYFWDGANFIFASEIKAILASGHVPKELNPKAMWDYLTFRYVPGPETIWANIHKLPPGHTLTISEDRPEPRIERYWDIPYSDNVSQTPEKEYFEEFADLFLDAVRLRLIADVPVGILLSGGIDSSAVAAAIAEQHNARMSSFSIAFDDSPQISELAYARQMAERAGLDHNEIVIGQKEFVAFLPKMVHFTDEPLADLATVPLYYVSQLAAQKVKVVLSGEGSDEILGGYDFDRFVRDINEGDPDLRNQHVPPHMTNYLTSQEKAKLINKTRKFPDSMDIVRDQIRRAPTTDPLHQMLYTYCQSWLVEDLLMKADRASMANSIELRTPFLDYRLVEWAARAPAQVKVSNFDTKRPLRAFGKGRLPDEIIRRTKMGFPVPAYEWLSGGLKDWAIDMLSPLDAQLYRWLDRTEVQRQLQVAVDPESPIQEKHRLWNLLILELWCRQWNPK